MVLIFLVTTLEAFVLIGIGIWVARALDHSQKYRLLAELGLSGIGVLGVIATTALTLIWNLFLPLNEFFATMVLVFGLAGLGLEHRHIRRTLASNWVRTADVPIILAIVAVGAYFVARYYLNHSDSALYHIQTILQNTDGPVILGAANIHMRFGYNSLLYVFAGAFNYPFVSIGGSLIINCALAGLFGGAIVQSIASNAVKWRDAPNLTLGLVLVILVFEPLSIAGGVGSPGTDWPALSANAFATLLCLEIVSCVVDPPTHTYIPSRLLLVCLVSAWAITIKLTQGLAPVLAALSLIVVLSRTKGPERRSAAPAFVMAMSLGALWCLRGVLLSGCLAYPAFSSCIRALPWTVGEEAPKGDLAYMAAFGKIPGGARPDQVPPIGEWIFPWLKDLMSYWFMAKIEVVLAIAVIFLAVRVISRTRYVTAFEQLATPEQLAAICIALVQICSGILWFVVAPLPRYGEASLSVLAAIIFALCLPVPIYKPQIISNPIGFVVGFFDTYRWIVPSLLLAFVLTVFLFGLSRPPATFVSWPTIPSVSVEKVISPHGVKYYRPVNGSYYCWAAPRPCTYSIDPESSMRHFYIWTIIERVRPKELSP